MVGEDGKRKGGIRKDSVFGKNEESRLERIGKASGGGAEFDKVLFLGDVVFSASILSMVLVRMRS